MIQERQEKSVDAILGLEKLVSNPIKSSSQMKLQSKFFLNELISGQNEEPLMPMAQGAFEKLPAILVAEKSRFPDEVNQQYLIDEVFRATVLSPSLLAVQGDQYLKPAFDEALVVIAQSPDPDSEAYGRVIGDSRKLIEDTATSSAVMQELGNGYLERATQVLTAGAMDPNRAIKYRKQDIETFCHIAAHPNIIQARGDEFLTEASRLIDNCAALPEFAAANEVHCLGGLQSVKLRMLKKESTINVFGTAKFQDEFDKITQQVLDNAISDDTKMDICKMLAIETSFGGHPDVKKEFPGQLSGIMSVALLDPEASPRLQESLKEISARSNLSQRIFDIAMPPSLDQVQTFTLPRLG